VSELLTSLQAQAAPELERLADDLSDQFLQGLKGVLEGADAAARGKVEELVRQGYEFKRKALTADDQEQARQYAGAVETSVRRVRTVLLAERIVAEEQFAATVSDLFSQALDGLATIAKGMLTAVAAGLVQGTIQGITGGEGGGSFDPSSIFPFA